MEVLVIGDLHIGKRHKATYGDASIWDNRSLVLLAEILNKEKPKYLVLAGDIFDTSKPTAIDYAKLIFCVLDVPQVFILAGNHDLSMIKEDIAFSKLNNFDNITIIEPNSNSIMFTDELGVSYIGVGWCDTQSKYENEMQEAIDASDAGDLIITHANRVSWENDNDNSFTDDLYKQVVDKDILVLSGHEHKSSKSVHFVHLGSVVPHTIAETGPKYYWSGGLYEIELGEDIILTREEPDIIDPNKVYYIRPKKEITIDDLTMEQKDLTIDILADFKDQAIKEGFEKEFTLCLKN